MLPCVSGRRSYTANGSASYLQYHYDFPDEIELYVIYILFDADGELTMEKQRSIGLEAVTVRCFR